MRITGFFEVKVFRVGTVDTSVAVFIMFVLAVTCTVRSTTVHAYRVTFLACGGDVT
jgi:hypothetical protein